MRGVAAGLSVLSMPLGSRRLSSDDTLQSTDNRVQAGLEGVPGAAGASTRRRECEARLPGGSHGRDLASLEF
jgi:hypothetical protein